MIVLLPVHAALAPGCLPRDAWRGIEAALDDGRCVVGSHDARLRTRWCDALGGVRGASLEGIVDSGDQQLGAIVWVGNGVADVASALGQRGASVEQLDEVGRQPGGELLDAVAVVDAIVSPGGCPWAIEQDHQSLAPYALEEVCELIDAIAAKDPREIREELGDVLLQVLWHARFAEQQEDVAFSIDDVAAGMSEKMRRRRPHVFAGDTESSVATSVQATDEQWKAIKAAEKAHRESILEGIAVSLPSLARAAKVMSRAEEAGLGGVVEAAVPCASESERLGEAALALVRQARAADVDVEYATRTALVALERRVVEAENSSKGSPAS